MAGLACIVNILILVFWLNGTGKNPAWENYPQTELYNKGLVDSLGRDINRIFYIQPQENDSLDIETTKDEEGGNK